MNIHRTSKCTFNKKDGYRQLNVRQLGSLYAPGTIAVNVTWIEREFNACQTPRSMYSSIFNHFWNIASRILGAGWVAPIDLTNFCINVKSHLRMNQNTHHFLVKIQFFFWGGGTAPPRTPPLNRPPPIIKFLFRHWDIAVYRFRVTGFQQYSWAFCNHILLSPGYAPGTIAVNVTWIEREFNAC